MVVAGEIEWTGESEGVYNDRQTWSVAVWVKESMQNSLSWNAHTHNWIYAMCSEGNQSQLKYTTGFIAECSEGISPNWNTQLDL